MYTKHELYRTMRSGDESLQGKVREQASTVRRIPLWLLQYLHRVVWLSHQKEQHDMNMSCIMHEDITGLQFCLLDLEWAELDPECHNWV